jgi:hypothetical protein
MKYLIFDSGPIISLTMAGLLPVLEKLKKIFPGEFIITPQVKIEIIDKPLKIKKYKLEAIQVKNLLERGIIKLSSDIVSDQRLESEVKKILKITNGVLRTTKDKEKIKIIHKGEASCLAFSNLCRQNSVIVIDERTTRILTESPEKLEKLMERKLHTPLELEFSLIKDFKDFKFIRSTELIFLAYKKNLISMKKDNDLLDALLYGLKFKGAAISGVEIEEMKKLV